MKSIVSIQSFKCKEVFHCLWIIGTRSHDFCLQCVRSRLVLPSVSSVSLKFSKLRIEWLLWIYFYMIDNMTVWAYDIRCMFKRSKSMPKVHMSSNTKCFFSRKISFTETYNCEYTDSQKRLENEIIDNFIRIR